MSTLGDTRSHVADLVAAATGKEAYPYVPGRFQPPAIIVTNGAPYLEEGDTFGGTLIRLDVNYVTAAYTAGVVMNADADAVLEQIINALADSDGWSVESVYLNVITFGQQAGYLTATITVTKTVYL